MRIVSANLFCLNPYPRRALDAVAAQQGDVTVLIESTGRFSDLASGLLPPIRAAGLTRRGGMPVTIHARESAPVRDVRESRRGWVECRIHDVLVFAVHAVAPYLPWRISRRRDQLCALADRISAVEDSEHALAIGDFNTAHFERAWQDFEADAGPWRRVLPEGVRWTGTWPLGGVWAPIAVDHALTPPHLHAGPAGGTLARTFTIPGSDHLGLVVDLPGELGPRDAPRRPC